MASLQLVEQRVYRVSEHDGGAQAGHSNNFACGWGGLQGSASLSTYHVVEVYLLVAIGQLDAYQCTGHSFLLRQGERLSLVPT